MTTTSTYATLSLFVVVAMMFALGILTIGNNATHANTKHAEAPAIRARYRKGLCEGEELWYSPVRGTVLILCGIPRSAEWGGLIYRVTENNGERILSPAEACECTIFVESRHYWNHVVQRDGYIPLTKRPDVLRELGEMWGQ